METLSCFLKQSLSILDISRISSTNQSSNHTRLWRLLPILRVRCPREQRVLVSALVLVFLRPRYVTWPSRSAVDTGFVTRLARILSLWPEMCFVQWWDLWTRMASFDNLASFHAYYSIWICKYNILIRVTMSLGEIPRLVYFGGRVSQVVFVKCCDVVGRNPSTSLLWWASPPCSFRARCIVLVVVSVWLNKGWAACGSTRSLWFVSWLAFVSRFGEPRGTAKGLASLTS